MPVKCWWQKLFETPQRALRGKGLFDGLKDHVTLRHESTAGKRSNMSRNADQDLTAIFYIASQWKTHCLVGGKSLIWPDDDIWTVANLNNFKAFFIDKQDSSSDKDFSQKFQEQLARADDDVTRLSCDLLLVYFLFPTSVSRARKMSLVRDVASWKTISIEENVPAFKGFSAGVGNPGLVYNTQRPNELIYLARFTIEILKKDEAQRAALLDDHVQLRELLEKLAEKHREEFGRPPQTKHIILYLLFPEHYERIASEGHKGRIVEAFEGVLDGEMPEQVDDCLKVIRDRLENYLPKKELDFYWPPLRACWYVDGDGDTIGELRALHIKKQIVLYGPPGTGKTYQSRQLADGIIRQELLKLWGPAKFFSSTEDVERLVNERTHRVQFHPGYGYEDFVRGLQIGEGGKTEYRNGVLLDLVEKMNAEGEECRDVPVVLILDEMNRADLSKVLGECFSLLEDRDGDVTLAGYGGETRKVRLPRSLYFIGTMNLIDQSLENVDFALRRRFLWFFKGFVGEDFIAVCRHKWNALPPAVKSKKPWDRVEAEFTNLGERAALVNKLIDASEYLGKNYQIGHTYFCDAVPFVESYLLATDKRRNQVLFDGKGRGIEPVETLWRFSLRPLLEQYLAGVEASESKAFLTKVEGVLLAGAKA
jgi:5-methylcytosine-specific restriction protein B